MRKVPTKRDSIADKQARLHTKREKDRIDKMQFSRTLKKVKMPQFDAPRISRKSIQTHDITNASLKRATQKSKQGSIKILRKKKRLTSRVERPLKKMEKNKHNNSHLLWSEFMDYGTRNLFYIHKNTGESSWEAPKGWYRTKSNCSLIPLDDLKDKNFPIENCTSARNRVKPKKKPILVTISPNRKKTMRRFYPVISKPTRKSSNRNVHNRAKTHGKQSTVGTYRKYRSQIVSYSNDQGQTIKEFNGPSKSFSQIKASKEKVAKLEQYVTGAMIERDEVKNNLNKVSLLSAAHSQELEDIRKPNSKHNLSPNANNRNKFAITKSLGHQNEYMLTLLSKSEATKDDLKTNINILRREANIYKSAQARLRDGVNVSKSRVAESNMRTNEYYRSIKDATDTYLEQKSHYIAECKNVQDKLLKLQQQANKLTFQNSDDMENLKNWDSISESFQSEVSKKFLDENVDRSKKKDSEHKFHKPLSSRNKMQHIAQSESYYNKQWTELSALTDVQNISDFVNICIKFEKEKKRKLDRVSIYLENTQKIRQQQQRIKNEIINIKSRITAITNNGSKQESLRAFMSAKAFQDKAEQDEKNILKKEKIVVDAIMNATQSLYQLLSSSQVYLHTDVESISDSVEIVSTNTNVKSRVRLLLKNFCVIESILNHILEPYIFFEENQCCIPNRANFNVDAERKKLNSIFSDVFKKEDCWVSKVSKIIASKRVASFDTASENSKSKHLRTKIEDTTLPILHHEELLQSMIGRKQYLL